MKKNINFKTKHIKSNSFSLISFTNNFNKINSMQNNNELDKNNKLFGKKSINLNKKNNLNNNNNNNNKNNQINNNKNNDFNLPTYRKSNHQDYYKNKELIKDKNEKNILFNYKFKDYKNIIEYLKKYSNNLKINNYLLYKNNNNNNIRTCYSVKLNRNIIMKKFYFKNIIEINQQNFVHKSKSINIIKNNNKFYNDFYNIYKSFDNNNINLNYNIFQNNIILIQKFLRGFLLRKKFNNLLKKYFSIKIIFDYVINLFNEKNKKNFFSFLKFKDKNFNNKNSLKEKNKISNSKIKKEDLKNNNNNNHILKKYNSTISIIKKPKLMNKKNNNNNNEFLPENLIKKNLNKTKLNLNIINSNSTSLISINEEEPTHFTTEINNKENDSKNEYKKLYENLFQNYTKLIEINNNNNKKFKNLSVNKIKNFSCNSNNIKNKFKNLQICSNEINLINQNKNNFQNENNNFQIISIENFMIKNKKISNENKYSNNKIMKIENKTFFILNWVKKSKKEKSKIIFINKNKKDWIKLPLILEETIKNYYRPFLLRILFNHFKKILNKKNKKILNSILLKFFHKNFHSDLLFNFNKFYLTVCYVSIKERFSSNQKNFVINSNNNFQIINKKKNIFIINKLISFDFNSLIEKRKKKLLLIFNSNNSLKKYFNKWIKINQRKEKILKLKFRNKKNNFNNKSFNNNSLNKSISSLSSFQDYKILKTRFITDSNVSNHSTIFEIDKIIKLKKIFHKFNNKNIENKCFKIWKKKYKTSFHKKKFLKYFLMNLVVYFSNIETLINKLLHNQKYLLGTYMFKWYFNIYYKNN